MCFVFFPKAWFLLVGSLLVPALSELMSLPSFGLPSWHECCYWFFRRVYTSLFSLALGK